MERLRSRGMMRYGSHEVLLDTNVVIIDFSYGEPCYDKARFAHDGGRGDLDLPITSRR